MKNCAGAKAREREKSMRLDTKRFKQIMEKKNITIDDLYYRTGITPKSCNTILSGSGFTDVRTVERMAEAVGLPDLNEIMGPDYIGQSSKTVDINFRENVIEFITDEDLATLTISQGRYKTRIRELAKSHPDECQILASNKDGSILAHVPVSWIRIYPQMELTEEERERRAKTMRQNRQKK